MYNLIIVFVFLAVIFEIPIEVSFDLVSFISMMIGVRATMDISNSFGGLGVPGVRAKFLTGRRIDQC